MEYKIKLDNIILFYLIFLFFILYVLYVLLFKNNEKKQLMNYSYTTAIKGLMAIFIFFHHVALRITNIGLLKFLNIIGYPVVTVFLFISGYIETVQYKSKGKDYLKKYPLKKICRIYLPWIISLLIFALVLKVNDFDMVLKGLFMFKTIYRSNTYNWFIIYLLYFYIFQYISVYFLETFVHTSNRKVVIHCSTMMVSSLAWLFICFIFKLPTNWYYNSFTASIGVIFGFYNEEILKFVKNRNKLWLVLNIFFTAMLFALSSMFPIHILRYPIYFIDTLFISSLVFQLSYICNFDSKFFDFYGKISLELFLYGTGVFLIYYSRFKPKTYGLIIVFVIITVLSYLTNKVSSLVIKKMNFDNPRKK